MFTIDSVIFDLSDRDGLPPMMVDLPQLDGKHFKISVMYINMQKRVGFKFSYFRHADFVKTQKTPDFMTYWINNFVSDHIIINLPPPFGSFDPSEKYQIEIRKLSDKKYEITNFKRI